MPLSRALVTVNRSVRIDPLTGFGSLFAWLGRPGRDPRQGWRPGLGSRYGSSGSPSVAHHPHSHRLGVPRGARRLCRGRWPELFAAPPDFADAWIAGGRIPSFGVDLEPGQGDPERLRQPGRASPPIRAKHADQILAARRVTNPADDLAARIRWRREGGGLGRGAWTASAASFGAPGARRHCESLQRDRCTVRAAVQQRR